jgi:hypothetical protein
MGSRLLGRGRELGAVRTALDRAGGGVVVLHGLPGVGKTRLARVGVADLPHVYHRVPPLPEPDQRAALARALEAGPGGWSVPRREAEPPAAALPSAPAADEGWARLLLAAASAVPEGRGAALVLDDVHRLEGARVRVLTAVAEGLRHARARGRALHVVLVSPTAFAGRGSTNADVSAESVPLGPLGCGAAAGLLPGASALDRLHAYAVFGGLPAHLVLLERGLSLAANLRRLVLRPDSPLADAGLRLLERVTQAPARYVAILAVLASGESDWAGVHAGVPDLTASGQVAPYLKRLEEIGLVEVRRSLDASERGRNRRYRVTDPFFAFWFRFILPHREELVATRGADAVAERVRTEMASHLASILPEVCRHYMRHDAIESLGANARECGSLWGQGYDIPVAGILSSGAAFYGRPDLWGGEDRSGLDTLDREVRETRYGFGRERRLRVLFLPGEAPQALVRAAARRHDVALVDARALSGAG